MFNPLNIVIVTILASIFLHEEIYSGSVVGAVTVILGLYTVLWGKAKDIRGMNAAETHLSSHNGDTKVVSVLIDGSVDKTRCKTDLEEPLLLENITTVVGGGAAYGPGGRRRSGGRRRWGNFYLKF